MDEQQIHDFRLSERELEYRQRKMELQLAASGIAPVGLDANAPSHGADAFVASLSGVEVDRVAEMVATVHEHGYAVADLLDHHQVAELREAMAPFFASSQRMFGSADPVLGHNQTIHVHNLLGKTDATDAITAAPMLRAIVAGILGHDFIFNAGAVAMAPDPGCSPQGLHRDDGYFAVLPRPRPPLVVTVAIALDDFTRDNGGTRLVPGSCRWPAERQPQPEEIEYGELPAGSMLIWDGATYHGGGGNRTTDRTRRTLTLNYTRGWLRTQFNQYLCVPRERVLAMPAELQADLGYHRSALGLGGCDLEDPLRYLQRLQSDGGDGAQDRLGREYAP
ncbi:MAG: phytanoyl-CoA dioxygenase family protein [Pseudomonadales bacterium]|nr:phytanoyl-CoA dioxygenase family protein [Pseudomonadales bacterium]